MDSPESMPPRESLESVAIRRATRLDGEMLGCVAQRAVTAAAIIEPVARDWGKFAQSDQHFIYLAEDDAPFGFVCAGSPLDAGVLEKGTGEIIGLYLLPAYWGHGMARKLLVRGLTVLKRRNYEHAFLWLPVDAQRARSVAGSLNFKPAGLSRATNLPGRELVENGFQLALADYF